uniref:Synaptotagmin-like 2a n=1 Tax=Sphaeramia orbicularis TaxID=375764 RepID=A0A672ZEJ7_9TELE
AAWCGCMLVQILQVLPILTLVRKGTMIDLSHLTEEEHGVIMTVMRRDAKLKKCEEERIRKLEKLLNTDSESDSKLKYLTGEWFYEAKSLRHMDTIHGSEIILASMKQRKPGLGTKCHNIHETEYFNVTTLCSEPVSPMKNQPPGDTSQTSGSDSVGFRPVPKKRTFVSRRSSAQTESDSQASDSQGRSAGIVPAPRRSLQQGSSGSSIHSCLKLSGSVMTMYSADLEVQGNIHFSIHYVQKLREFHIFVAQCQDLAAVDPKRGRSDPYVKTYLVPDKANLGKRKTSVKKKTLNPIFNEILRYRVRMEYLRTQTLILSVWHHDTFGRNSFLGEVDVDLSKWDFDHTQMNYLALKARYILIYFLCHFLFKGLAKDNANSGEIHIWVKECKNLPLIRATIDPYVKCFVLPDTSRKSRQKTRVLRRTVDPVFNHTMVYDGIREADLTEACVELTVLDRDRLGSNLLGGLRLGTGTGRSYGAMVDWMDSTPYEVALWERMIASPNEWVEDVLPLRKLNSKAALK